MNVSDVVRKVAEAGERNIKISPRDYQRDGLWICGECGTPKETRITLDGSNMIVRCLCDCQIERLRAEKLAEAAREREYLRREWLGGYEWMTFAADNGKNTTMGFARKYTQNWEMIRDSGYSCTLTGPVGCGKTFAAASIANEVFNKGARVWMIGAGRLVDEMGFETMERTNTRLKIFDLVIIDDFGAERNTGYSAQKILDAIDLRARSELPTIITTNIDTAKVPDDPMMARIISRLNGFAPTYICRGEDLRQSAGKERRAQLSKLLKGEQ